MIGSLAVLVARRLEGGLQEPGGEVGLVWAGCRIEPVEGGGLGVIGPGPESGAGHHDAVAHGDPGVLGAVLVGGEQVGVLARAS